MEEFSKAEPDLTHDHAQTLIHWPCIPAQYIGKKIVSSPEKSDIKAAIDYWNSANACIDILGTFHHLDPQWSLHLFYQLPNEIKQALSNNDMIEANDKHHVYLCNTFAKIAQSNLQKWMEKNIYTPEYRWKIHDEAYFILSLTPTSNRSWRKLQHKEWWCLVFQHYSVFDSMKQYDTWARHDNTAMKKLRDKIRNHPKNWFIKCPYLKKQISQYPFEMPDIPLEAAEISITNKDETIEQSTKQIAHVLHQRPIFKQLPWDPDLWDMEYNDLKKVSISTFKDIHALNT